MAKRGIYSSVSRPKKNNAKIAATVLGVITALLVIFIVWCAFMFSGSGVYGDKVSDISELKIQLEEKDAQLSELREQIAKLEEQKRQLEENAVKQPEPSAEPSASPSAKPTAKPTKTPAAQKTAAPENSSESASEQPEQRNE